MTDYRSARVSLVDGNAQVEIGRKAFTVTERQANSETHNCPVELVFAALGS